MVKIWRWMTNVWKLLVNKDDEVEENKKRRSLSILFSLGEIRDGAKRSEMNKSNVKSLDDEYDMCVLEVERKSDNAEVIVADIREGGEYENDRKYNKVEICGSSKQGDSNCLVTDVEEVLDDANGKERELLFKSNDRSLLEEHERNVQEIDKISGIDFIDIRKSLGSVLRLEVMGGEHYK
ncbi:hypothetical protein Tco_0478901 [Tanacetum coccineum]